MNEEKAVLKNTAYQMAGKVVTSGIGLVMTMLLTRYLGAEGYGLYSLALAYVGIIFLVANFGLDPLLIRTVAETKSIRKAFAPFFILRVLLSVSVLILGVIGAFFLSYSSTVIYGIVIAGIGQMFLMLSHLLWDIHKGNLQYHRMVRVQIATSIVHILMLVVALWLQVSIEWIYALYAAGFILGFGLSVLDNDVHITVNMPWNKIAEIARKALPFGLAVGFSIAYLKIDALMLGYYFPPEMFPDLGYYSVGYKIFDVVVLIGGFYTQTLLPYFSAHKDIGMKQLLRFLGYTVLIAVGGGVSMYLLSDMLIFLLGGQEFAPSIGIVHILSLAAALTIMHGYAGSYMLAHGKERVWLYISIFALVLNVALNIVFIPDYSFIGASWTTVVTQLAVALALGSYMVHLVQTKKS